VPDLALNLALNAEWTFTVGNFDQTETSVKLSDVRVPSSVLNSDDPIGELRTLLGVNGGDQVAISAGARKRQSSSVQVFDIDIEAASKVQAGQNAILLAKSVMMASELVDFSNARISMTAPGRPTKIAPDQQPLDVSSTEDELPWVMIVAIGAAVLCCVVLFVGVACLIRRKAGHHASDSPAATEMAPYAVNASKMSSRRKKKSSRREMIGPNGGAVVPPSVRRASGRRKLSSHTSSPHLLAE